MSSRKHVAVADRQSRSLRSHDTGSGHSTTLIPVSKSALIKMSASAHLVFPVPFHHAHQSSALQHLHVSQVTHRAAFPQELELDGDCGSKSENQIFILPAHLRQISANSLTKHIHTATYLFRKLGSRDMCRHIFCIQGKPRNAISG